MVKFAFMTNYNLNTDILTDEMKKVILDVNYYESFLDILDEVPTIHSPTGLFVETLEDTLLKEFKRKFKNKYLANHTYSHPILTLIDDEDEFFNIKLGNIILRKAFDTNPSFFYPPEWLFTPYTVYAVNENGINDLISIDLVFDGFGQKPTVDKFFYISGLFGSVANGLAVYTGGVNLSVRNTLFSLLEGKISPEEAYNKLLTLSQNKEFILLYLDSEAGFFVKNWKQAIKALDSFFQLLKSNDLFVSSLEDIKHSNKNLKYTLNTYKDIGTWINGSPKIDKLVCKFKYKMIANNINMSDMFEDEYLMEAIKRYFRGINSDARLVLTYNRINGIEIDGKKYYGNFNILKRAYEDLVTANQMLDRYISQKTKSN